MGVAAGLISLWGLRYLSGKLDVFDREMEGAALDLVNQLGTEASTRFDTGQPGLYAWNMEVDLNADLQARLAHLASQQGRAPEALAREAIERLVDYDEWFIREVEKGLAQSEEGNVLTHERVGARVERLPAEKQSRV